ncbi:MAG: glycosyltransferase family 4 protein [Oligoflexus sp.]|nr:glycosyltransferase family 4 protein [Oligoflexus sp.]
MNKKIRVLNISKPYVAAAYRQKFRFLAEDPRFEIGLITPKNWAGQDFEDLPGESYWLRTLGIAFNGKNHFHFYQGLREAIREFAPDIVNIEEEHYSFVTFQVMREARKIGARCIFHTWQNIDKNYPPPFAWMEAYVLKNCAYAVTGNQEALDILRRKGFAGPAAVIPQMGADAEAITKAQQGRERHRQEIRDRLKIPMDALLLMFAGRFVEEKGIQDGLDAVAMLKAEGRNVHFMMLGGGPFEAELRAKAKALAIEDLIHWIGSVPSLHIYPYFAVADVLLLSSHTRSNWKEQFGRVLVEAMLSGCVPIGSNSGEIPHVIGPAGLVHQEADPRDLARCILSLDQDRALLFRLGLIGKDRVSENYTNRVIAEKYAAIFLEVAKKP